MNDKRFVKIKTRIFILFLIIQFFLVFFKTEINSDLFVIVTIKDLLVVAGSMSLLIVLFYYLPLLCVIKLTYLIPIEKENQPKQKVYKTVKESVVHIWFNPQKEYSIYRC